MAAPVWVLSVDLQTKTATFQTGMADAAKAARGAFTEIQSGSAAMGAHVSGSMMNARHGIMLVGEEFGVHLPRALMTFMAELGPVAGAMETAFPFLAVAVGATLLIQHLVKLHEEGEKLTQDQVRFGTAVQNAFNTLDQKLLSSRIKADELRNDHLGALHKQLELIDKQSMAELVHSFEEVAKSADVVMGELQSHWYTFGIGSAGAKHALDTFQTSYNSLLAEGKDADATNLLKGTLTNAEAVLQAQKLSTGARKPDEGSGQDRGAQFAAAMNTLKAAGVGWTEQEVQAQQTLVDALNSQLSIEGKVAAIKKQDSSNATTGTGKEMAAMAAEGARQSAEHLQKMGELALANEREQANVSLSLKQSTIAERLASDLHLADEEYQLQLVTNQRLTDALDKGNKDYQNQLRAAQARTEEITAQHHNAIAALQGHASEEVYRKALQDMEQSEREQIDATQQGSSQRLAVIDAALKAEQAKNLQDTSHYRDLMTQRVEVTRQMAEEQAKLAAEAGKEDAENTLKVGELTLAAEREHQALLDSSRRMTLQRQIQEEVQAANAEYALKLQALQREEAALDKGAKDYQNKLKEAQDKERQLVQPHENEITSIKDKAETERNQKILAAEDRFNDEIASGLTQVLMGHKSFTAMMNSLGDQVVSGMMQNAIKSLLIDDMTKERDAAAAARKAFNIGLSIGGPAGVILGPVFAAAAFAGVMAFSEGGIVPGVGRGDVVPAMLTPGEAILPKALMDRLNTSGDSGSGTTTQVVHMRPTYHLQALDTTGMARVLDKHSDQLQRHFEDTLRKMNR